MKESTKEELVLLKVQQVQLMTITINLYIWIIVAVNEAVLMNDSLRITFFAIGAIPIIPFWWLWARVPHKQETTLTKQQAKLLVFLSIEPEVDIQKPADVLKLLSKIAKIRLIALSVLVSVAVYLLW